MSRPACRRALYLSPSPNPTRACKPACYPWARRRAPAGGAPAPGADRLRRRLSARRAWPCWSRSCGGRLRRRRKAHGRALRRLTARRWHAQPGRHENKQHTCQAPVKLQVVSSRSVHMSARAMHMSGRATGAARACAGGHRHAVRRAARGGARLQDRVLVLPGGVRGAVVAGRSARGAGAEAHAAVQGGPRARPPAACGSHAPSWDSACSTRPEESAASHILGRRRGRAGHLVPPTTWHSLTSLLVPRVGARPRRSCCSPSLARGGVPGERARRSVLGCGESRSALARARQVMMKDAEEVPGIIASKAGLKHAGAPAAALDPAARRGCAAPRRARGVPARLRPGRPAPRCSRPALGRGAAGRQLYPRLL